MGPSLCFLARACRPWPPPRHSVPAPGLFPPGLGSDPVSLILQALFSGFNSFELVRSGQALPPALWLILSFSVLFLGWDPGPAAKSWRIGCAHTGKPCHRSGGSVSRLEDTARFLESADVWINTLDLEARVTFWNTTAETISGYQAAEVTRGFRNLGVALPGCGLPGRSIHKSGRHPAEGRGHQGFGNRHPHEGGRNRIFSWCSGS